VRKSSRSWLGRAIAIVIVGAVFCVLGLMQPTDPATWLLCVLLLAATLLESPVYAAMAGLGMIFFWRESTPVSAVSAEIYRLIASPTLPAYSRVDGNRFCAR